MHYYTKNLGDYYKKAGRLSILQHGVYNLLIDAIYDRERFPTLTEAKAWAWCGTAEEIDALEFVLNRFFEENGAGIFEQKRIREELDDYKTKAKTNSKNGKKGGRPKKETAAVPDDTTDEKLPVPVIPKAKGKNLITKKELNNLFVEFYGLYPRKIGKANALAKYAIAIKKESPANIIKGLKNQLAANQFSADPGFIPHPATWLNQQRWLDEIERKVNGKSGGLADGINNYLDGSQ